MSLSHEIHCLKSVLQYILNGVKNIAMIKKKNSMVQMTKCELQVCNMRIVFFANRILFSASVNAVFIYNNFT